MMTKKWFTYSLLAATGICLFIFAGTDAVRSEQEQPETLVEQPVLKEETISQKASPVNEEELLARTIFITIPEIFEDLERAPVRFAHDKHTLALETEGCEACHPRDDKGIFAFSYPKERDDTGATRLMNDYHDSCIGCHTERAEKDQKAGPVTCGECHISKDAHRTEYLPIMPEYYEVLRDTYHRDCLSCHQDPAKAAEDAGGLNWKNFYVKESQKLETEWPQVSFDYFLHDKHDKALEQKCELCHYLSPQAEKDLAAEGKEPACKDWLREIDKENSLTDEETAHPRCINCHLEKKNEKKDSGPIHCKGCHDGVIRTAEEMQDIPRPECEQEEKILIQLEKEARMKGAAFDHKAHQKTSRGCQDCHHDSLRACRECHPQKGIEEGGFINLAEAFHEVSSPWSCIGCHETEKRKNNCAGCHHLMESGLVESACSTCHSGSLESLDVQNKRATPDSLYPDELKEELEINIIENEYKHSTFPHDKIVEKLTEVSNESRLARYFHTDEMAVCAGCHHFGPLEKKTDLALCSSCHTTRKEPQKEVPTLLGAYHRQCLGCHQQMGGTEKEMPQKCEGCHEEKKKISFK